MRDRRKTFVTEGEDHELHVSTRSGRDVVLASDMTSSDLRAIGRTLDEWIARGAPMSRRQLIEPSSNYLAYATIVLLAVGGILFVIRSGGVASFETRGSRLQVHRRAWWGGRVLATSVGIERVAEVFIATSTSDDTEQAQLTLRLDDGTLVALEPDAAPNDERRRALEEIRSFVAAQPGASLRTDDAT